MFISASLSLTLAFAAALVTGLVVKFWLASRQIRHIALHRNAVPAAFADRITLAAHQKAADYTIAKSRLGLLEMALGAAVLVGWTLLGGLSWLNQSVTQWLGGGAMLSQLALLAAFAFIGSLIDLPITLYQTFVLEERFGFNKMTFKLWFVDLVKSTLVGGLIGLPIVALILWVMGGAGGVVGSLWWLWAWGLWMGFNLLLLLIYPSFIAPLFNKFKPLEDETLKTRVTALMQRCGFAAKGLFVMDGSKRSAHANAYFTGFGASKRVVFYDTLLAKLSAPEVDAVLAHELGHFKHKHIIKRILSMFALSLGGFALLGWLATQAWFYTGLGVTPNMAPTLATACAALPPEGAIFSWTGPAFSKSGVAKNCLAPNDALTLILFMLALPVFGFFISPLFAQISRKHEFEADAYAVAQTSGTDLSTALLKMYEDNASTLTPDPLFVKFYYSHPPASERLLRMAA